MKLLKRSTPLRALVAEQLPRTRRSTSPEDARSALLREYQTIASANCFVGTNPRFTDIAIEQQRERGRNDALIFTNVRSCWALWDDPQVYEIKVRLALEDQKDWILYYLLVGTDFHLRETIDTVGLIRRASTLYELQSPKLLRLLLVATGHSNLQSRAPSDV